MSVSRFFGRRSLVISRIATIAGLVALIPASVPDPAAADEPLPDEYAQAEEIPVYGYKVVNSYPHDPEAFTQGLFFKDGYIYESTGRYGESTIRKIELKTGEVIQMSRFPARVFGEGITEWDGKLYGLTWKNRVGFEWNLNSFALERRFAMPGEGWGLTHSATELVMSDGTAVLQFLDPLTLGKIREIQVTANDAPVGYLNELEWIEGEIYANIWQTDLIARIDPKNGRIIGWIDLDGLLGSQGPVHGNPDFLNGIAVSDHGNLLVTGKLWPKLFEIETHRK